jgi:carbon-monoxide dehydrogenase medium subunit
LALADPAAEMPAVAVALRAELELASVAGRRTAPAEEFYRGLYDTARRPDELLVAIRFPFQGTDEICLFEELSRRHGDFAIVGLAGRIKHRQGRFADARIVYFGGESHARPATALARCLQSRAWNAETEALVAEAVAKDLQPSASLEGSSAFKLSLARTLTHRALARIALGPPEDT